MIKLLNWGVRVSLICPFRLMLIITFYAGISVSFYFDVYNFSSSSSSYPRVFPSWASFPVPTASHNVSPTCLVSETAGLTKSNNLSNCGKNLIILSPQTK